MISFRNWNISNVHVTAFNLGMFCYLLILTYLANYPEQYYPSIKNDYAKEFLTIQMLWFTHTSYSTFS